MITILIIILIVSIITIFGKSPSVLRITLYFQISFWVELLVSAPIAPISDSVKVSH